MRVTVENGRVVKVDGDPDHPVTRGFLCVKTSHYAERVYSPDRVLYPLRRVGAKGEGRFQRISWDEAVGLVAERLRQVVTEHGGEAVLPYSYCGTMGLLGYGSMDRRFFHRLGASQLGRTICSAAGSVAMDATVGARVGPDPEDMVNARLIILWGVNAVATNIHQVPILQEARRRGATLVCIDPYRNATARLADWHLQPRPGTDGALALALAHVIFAEGLQDQAYLKQYTIGADEYRLRAADWPPERAEAVTGVPAADLRRLARLYAASQPSLLRVGYGLQRHTNGGSLMRAVLTLPALTGAWRHPGGGYLLSNSGSFRWNKRALERPDLMPAPVPREINMSRLGEALVTAAAPPVKLLFVYNANPAGVAPNQNRVITGLQRTDLFVVVHEQMLTDTCLYADIVLPATTQLEHLDIHGSYWHLYAQLSEPVIPPLGEAVPNPELFRRLAVALGFTEPCFQDRDEELVLQALEGSAVAATAAPDLRGRAQAEAALALLRDRHWLKVDRAPAPFAAGQFPTPSGKIELYSSRLAQWGQDPIPGYTPTAESPDGAPEKFQLYPLQVLTPAAHHFLNSSYANLPTMMRGEHYPVIFMHPEDARERGVREGDWLRLFNDRGQAFVRARVGDWTQPGVAVSPSLWWNQHSPGGQNVNALTTDAVSDLGGGAAFHTNLVQAVRVADAESAALAADFSRRTAERMGLGTVARVRA